jgi:betaine-aldehyde dehydrogenase
MATAAPTVPGRLLFIDGAWVAPVKGKFLDVINPATEEVVGQIPAGTAEDVAAAVAAANRAHASGIWGKKTGAERAVVLRAIVAKVRRATL